MPILTKPVLRRLLEMAYDHAYGRDGSMVLRKEFDALYAPIQHQVGLHWWNGYGHEWDERSVAPEPRVGVGLRFVDAEGRVIPAGDAVTVKTS